jgi:hypothetical protein
MPIIVGRTVRLRDCGYDEYWLQDRIFENPPILGLGELEGLARERQQSSGGKLDILLKDPEENAMYEVEVMLGQTDESHIIRAIEYWDIEKRKWPQRQHYCVLVAEVISRRFFNVIHLLSASIPIIAVQANIIEADGRKILNFTKVLDVYEEPEDSVTIGDETYDESYWRDGAAHTAETAYNLLNVVREAFPDATIGFVKYYISIGFRGSNKFWLRDRSGQQTLITLWLEDADLDRAQKLLDVNGIQYESKKDGLKLRVKSDIIGAHASVFKELAELMKDY